MSAVQRYEETFNPAEYTILIVDDHPENLRILDTYLKDQGFNTLIASKGELAVKRAQYSHPDLILLDVLLPDFDGFETCRRLKSDPHTNDIPVIFMTALTETTHKLKGFQVGGVDYVTKPFQYEEILARLSTHLRLRSLTRHLQAQAETLAQRATQLEASSHVAQHINAILDPEELLTTVATLMQSRFRYYFAGVWLVSEQTGAIMLHASSGARPATSDISGAGGEASASFKLIETVWHSGELGLIDNFQEHVIHDPFTPNTCSEAAIPLKHGANVIGVLDIRHDRPAAFAPEDIAVLQLLANQISIALHNARLYNRLEQTNVKLEEMSVTDPLTGLRNRRYLARFIQHDLAKVHRELNRRRAEGQAAEPSNADIGFLMLDIDHFKDVNDTYGHAAGDRVLEQIRDILLQCCRQTDIPIRWGGEEFLIEARFVDRKSLQIVAGRIHHMVQAYPFEIGRDAPLHLTCSIGFASYPFLLAAPEQLNWEQVVSVADRGLYIAKMSGRNAWVGMTASDTAEPDQIFARIQHALPELISAGDVLLTTSFPPEHELVL